MIQTLFTNTLTSNTDKDKYESQKKKKKITNISPSKIVFNTFYKSCDVLGIKNYLLITLWYNMTLSSEVDAAKGF